jgi:hypothetical protein
MSLRKGKKLLKLGSNEVLTIERASNNRENGLVLTDKGELSTDYICRQLDFGLMRLLSLKPSRLQTPRVGTVVVANHTAGSFQKGDIGVCYELYKLGEHEGASFIFQNRFYDGFSKDNDYKWLLEIGFSENISKYKFENVVQLERDYISGTFDSTLRGQLFTHFYDI